MKKYDRIYLTKFAVDPNSEYTYIDDFIDFDLIDDNKIDQFADENIDELEDMFWKE